MKKYLVLGLLLVSLSVNAAGIFKTYTVKSGDTLQTVATANGTTTAALLALNPSIALQRGQTLNVGYNSVTPPVIIPPTSTNEITHLNVYTTGYGYPDNTPKNSAAISNPVLHQSAGGTGTFSDPITLAVGHSISGGTDTLDFAKGTKFYIPNLRRYFLVEDTCGDGNSPQNGPCHNVSTADQGSTLWLDLWVGGVGKTSSGTIACEDAITSLHTVIENPSANYAVVAGEVYNGTCSQQYGNTLVTQ